MSVALAVAKYLAASGVGSLAGSSGWVVNAAAEPATPDDAVTVYDTGGAEPDTDELDLQPTFQVRVRSKSYVDAYAKHAAIRDLLVLPFPVTADALTLVGVELSSDVAAIGRDANERHLLVANYRTRIEQ